jgi:hypothetical protein
MPTAPICPFPASTIATFPLELARERRLLALRSIPTSQPLSLSWQDLQGHIGASIDTNYSAVVQRLACDSGSHVTLTVLRDGCRCLGWSGVELLPTLASCPTPNVDV